MVDAVYVLHVPRFTDRAAHMRAELGRFDIPFEFIDTFNADDLDAATCECMLAPGTRLKPPDLSLILKHMEAFRRIVAAKQRCALILEDDVLLNERFDEELTAILEEAKAFDHPHIIQIGCANNMYVPKALLQPGRRLYEIDHGRATDSYLIGAEASRLRLEWLANRKFDRPVGHLFNESDREKRIRIYWSEPTIVEQGSMNGLFPTTLAAGRKDKPLWFLKWRFRWQRLRKKSLYRMFK